MTADLLPLGVNGPERFAPRRESLPVRAPNTPGRVLSGTRRARAELAVEAV